MSYIPTPSLEVILLQDALELATPGLLSPNGESLPVALAKRREHWVQVAVYRSNRGEFDMRTVTRVRPALSYPPTPRELRQWLHWYDLNWDYSGTTDSELEDVFLWTYFDITWGESNEE